MFSLVVQLYRALGRPPVVGGVFEFEGIVSPETIMLIASVAELPPRFGTFLNQESAGNHVELEFSLPASEYGRFHISVDSFISVSPSLEWGHLPNDFYILDLDFFSRDETRPEIIQKLADLCEFILLITKLSIDPPPQYVQPNSNRLTFILVANEKIPAKTFSIITKFTAKILALDIRHMNLLRALLSEEKKNHIHVEERRSIMRLAIAETIDELADGENLFELLLGQWSNVLSRYRHNVLAFVNQFSFEKIRKEIANAQIEYATKLSGVLGDVAGKLLALPLSFAGLLLLRNVQETDEFIIYALGLLVASGTAIGILINQWVQVKRLEDSFKIVFSQYDEKLPAKLKAPILATRASLDKQRKILSRTFVIFGLFALIPVLGVAWYWLTHFFLVQFSVWLWAPKAITL
jgi:hypothetical protein